MELTIDNLVEVTAASASLRAQYESKAANQEDIAMYKKLRLDNVALDHHTAIELVKMIKKDICSLRADDFRL